MPRALSMPSVDILRQCFDYDPATGLLTWRRRPSWQFACDGTAARWNGRWAGRPALNAPTNCGGHRGGSVTIRGKTFKLLARRVIWKLVHGTEPTGVISHWDGDTASNVLANLRHSAISLAIRDQRRNKSGLKGAYRSPGGRWFSSVWKDGRTVHLGMFGSAEEAHKAWVVANVKVAGRFFNPGYGSVFD